MVLRWFGIGGGPKQQRSVQDSGPVLIDPLKFRASDELVRERPNYEKAFEYNSGGLSMVGPCLEAYIEEIAMLERLVLPKGRRVFQGLGFYPEIGADLLLLPKTRKHGRLVGAGLNPSELMAGAALLYAMGYVEPAKVVGSFKGNSFVRRNIDSALAESGLDDAREFRDRIMWESGFFKLKDWEHFGVCMDWEHFTFLSSASGDKTMVAGYLGDNAKFDYLVLKGAQLYAHSAGQAKDRYGSWLASFSRRFMKDDALVLVSQSIEESAGGILPGLGFEKLEVKHVAYPELTGEIIVSGSKMKSNVLGTKIPQSAWDLSFMPVGDFSLFQKRRS